MTTVFSRATQALAADHGRRSRWGILLSAAILGGWAAWGCLARLAVYAVTDTARLEVARAVYPIETPVDGRVAATHLTLGREVRDGEVLVELEAESQRLQREEEHTRLAALTRQLEALRVEVATTTRALTEAQQVAQVALDEDRAQFQEALARAQFATEEATRSTRLHARGLLAELDLLRVQAEAQRRQAAANSLRLAVDRLQRERQLRQSDRKAQLERLQREITQLEGQRTTVTATLERLAHEMGRRHIRAPVAGRLGEVATLQVGTFVKAGDKLGAVVPAGSLTAVAEFLPSVAMGRVRAGQPARLRLDSFPWTQYGSLATTVSSVASEVRDGRVRVELTVAPELPTRLPLQHGLRGTVEVEVEQATPATLVLRAAGQLLASPRAWLASQDSNTREP
jgi:membrane fusion protein (multidrug efflux system)